MGGKDNIDANFLRDDLEGDDEDEEGKKVPIEVRGDNTTHKPAYIIPINYVKSGTVLKIINQTGQWDRWARLCPRQRLRYAVRFVQCI